VAKDYSYTLLDPRDLRDFAGLTTCTLTQKQRIVLGVGWELVRWHLEGMFGTIEEGLDKDGVPTIRVYLKRFLNECLSLIYCFCFVLILGYGSCRCETHTRTRANVRMGVELK